MNPSFMSSLWVCFGCVISRFSMYVSVGFIYSPAWIIFAFWVRVRPCALVCVSTCLCASLLPDSVGCCVSSFSCFCCCFLIFLLILASLLLFSLCVVLFVYLRNSQTHCLLFICGLLYLFYLPSITDYVVRFPSGGLPSHFVVEYSITLCY